MKKLNKKQSKRLDEIVALLREKGAELEAAVTAYNEALAHAQEFRDEIVAEMEAYQEERSEAWHDGDAGSAYSEWKGEWEALELDDLEDPAPEHADALEQAPQEVGG